MDATTSSRVRANDFVTSLICIIYIDEKKALDHTHIRRHYNELLSRIKNLFNKREGRFHGSRRFVRLFRLLRVATKPGYARIRQRYVDTRVAVIQARSEYVADMAGVDPTHRIKKKSWCNRTIFMTSFSSYSILTLFGRTIFGQVDRSCWPYFLSLRICIHPTISYGGDSQNLLVIQGRSTVSRLVVNATIKVVDKSV